MYRLLFNTPKRYFGLSYVNVPSQISLKYKTIGQQLRDITQKYPDNIAMVSCHQKHTLTYEQLLSKSQQIAGAFIALGLKKGDRIGIYSPNKSEWTIVQYAAALADLILVNINPAYQIYELKYALNKVGCKALITANSHKSSNYIHILNELIPELKSSTPGQLNSKELPHLKTIIRIDDELSAGMYNFKSLYDMPDSKHFKELSIRENYMNPEDPTNIQFTSGTTGFPKGATLSHHNVLNNIYFGGKRLQYSEKDRICLPVPLYHCFGMVLGNLAAINFGSTVVYPSEGFSSKATMEAVSDLKCTSLYGVPTMFIECLNEYERNPDKYDVSSLKKGFMAGALCPKVLMEKCIKHLNLTELAIGYGMTETSPICFLTFPNDTMENKTNTIGKVLEHTEAKIVDPEGRVVPHDVPGEIYVRGFSVMLNYWGDEKETAQTIDKSGWLKTGDIGIINKEGYGQIVGRIKDIIIRGGENIYPKEIEDFLLTMPNIENCQAVGVPDEKFGEEVLAAIKLKDPKMPISKNDILKFCKHKIAHYKIPKYVKFVTEFPLTVTGKIQKYKIRDEVKEELKDKKLYELYKLKQI